MATVPLSGTNIRLISGVPFSNDYKNTRWFDNQASQESYFLGKPIVHQIQQANYQRREGWNYIAVNKSLDELHLTNYLMFQNEQYNVKWFYGFVTKLEYVQLNVTNVYFEIDIFHTWKFEMNFKPSFVVREHCKQYESDGLPVENTIDEGLHYGDDYETVSVEHFVPYDNIFFMVIVAKQTMHGGSAEVGKITPVLNGMPQPLSYYIHPFKLDGTTPVVEMMGMPLNMSTISDVMKSLYTQQDAVNNIVSIYITEHIGANVTHSTNNMAFSETYFEHVTIQDETATINTLYVSNVEEYVAATTVIGPKYEGYKAVTESKLLMYPYTVLILDDFRGNRVELKNEHIDGAELKITVRGSMGTSNKVTYAVTDYLADDVFMLGDRLVLSLEHSVINNSPNDVPIITDLLSAYIQGNKNQISNQREQIGFNGMMNNLSSGVSGISSAATGNFAGSAQSLLSIGQGTGNSLLQMQAIQAKQNDINNVPPTIQKMGGNTAYEFGNDYQGIYIIKKQVRAEHRKKLTDFFKMYGYKLNEVKIPNFHTRQSWNYVQTVSCNITGNFNNDDLNTLKSVFDNGITFWHTDDVGNYALANEVL